MAYVRTLTPTPDDAADLFQDLSLALLVAGEVPAARDAFLRWCRGVVRNLALHRHRDSRRDGELFCPEDRGLEEEDRSASPERVLAWRVSVERSLRRLDARSQRLLVLRYVAGWTAEELALRTRQSPAAVRMRLKRLRDQVRRALGALP